MEYMTTRDCFHLGILNAVKLSEFENVCKLAHIDQLYMHEIKVYDIIAYTTTS